MPPMVSAALEIQPCRAVLSATSTPAPIAFGPSASTAEFTPSSLRAQMATEAPFCHEQVRYCPADAPGAAGDDCLLAAESEIHGASDCLLLSQCIFFAYRVRRPVPRSTDLLQLSVTLENVIAQFAYLN